MDSIPPSPDTETCKAANIAFEKFENYEYTIKGFSTACQKILDKRTGERLVDNYILKIDSHTYRTLPSDHPFRTILSLAKRDSNRQ